MLACCDACWPLRIGAIARICFAFASGVGPSLMISAAGYIEGVVRNSHILAFKIQSRSSSPSSGPPGPPCTALKYLGCHSLPVSALLAASSLCISSILVLSSVAASWFPSFSATIVLCHSFCDSRSSCSSRGRAMGGVCFACVALKRSSFFPV